MAPSLGHGTVPRIARSLWALVAVVGVVWAVWSSVKHVMFLDFSTLDFGNLGAAIDAAALGRSPVSPRARSCPPSSRSWRLP